MRSLQAQPTIPLVGAGALDGPLQIDGGVVWNRHPNIEAAVFGQNCQFLGGSFVKDASIFRRIKGV